MSTQQNTLEIIELTSKKLNIETDRIMKLGLKAFLENELREIQSEIFRLGGKYQVRSAKEIDEKYEKGILEEENTWQDFFQLDHLEYKRDSITKLLEETD